MRGKGVPYRLAGSAAFLTFLVYLPALRNGFVELDDAVYVLENPHIRSIDPNLFRWAFVRYHAANWHPLTWISHAVDYALWGLNPVGHHLSNIIFHAINTALVVLLVLKLLEAAREGGAPDMSKPPLNDRTVGVAAGITGLLFGIHPAHVESVAWVAERKDLLCACFFLLSLLAYTDYAKGESPGAAGTPTASRFLDRRYLAALGFFALALMSKPMAVSLPCVLLLLDWFPYGRISDFRTFRTALTGKLPFIGMSLASSILTVAAQSAGEALVSTQLVPLSGRVLVAARSLLAYLGMLALPRDLAPYYPYPALHGISLSSAGYLLPVFLLVAITAMSVNAMKRQRIWLAVWCYYLVTLLPVVGIVQVGGQAMADRYTYLPSLGPFLLAGVGSAWMYGRAIAGTASPRLVNRAGIAAVGAVFLILSISTARQIGIWKDSMAVFDAILANDSRRSPMVYFHRGVAHQKGGMPERAVDDYTVAISLFPSYYDAFFGRGTAYEILGLYDQAIADYSVAISLRPASYEAYTNRGLAYKKTGRREESIADLNRAIALSSSAAKAYLNLGVLYFEEGRIADAVGHFSRAIAADPADPEAYANRGIGHAILGQSGAALRDFDKAIELRPDVSVFYYNRGKLFAGTGQRERARADFKKACELGDEAGCRALREGIAY